MIGSIFLYDQNISPKYMPNLILRVCRRRQLRRQPATASRCLFQSMCVGGFACSFISSVSAVVTLTLPLENSWFLLIVFKTIQGQIMDVEDLLVGLKFTDKVAAASKIKAQGMLIGKHPDKTTLQKSIDKVKNDFIAAGLLHQLSTGSS